jgi:hypothetical protein
MAISVVGTRFTGLAQDQGVMLGRNVAAKRARDLKSGVRR